MVVWWLILLGIVTYFAIQRSVSGLTRTPVWLLWLVMMMPVLLWLAWLAIAGESKPIPIVLLLGAFVTCPFIYWTLIQAGRRSPGPSSAPSMSSDPLNDNPPTRPSISTMSLTNDSKRPIDRDDEDALKRCFPWSVYYLKGIEYRPQALICTGHLRASSDVAYRTIRENIEKQFGQRFLIVFQEGLNGKPFFALVPNPNAAKATQGSKLFHPLIAAVLLVSTLFTTTFAGMMLAGVEVGDALPINPAMLVKGVPYCIALITILTVYHLSQYFMARRYQVKSSLPYFIPVPPVVLGFPFGTFGAFLQVRSPMPNRKVLFDMGFVGPAAGVLVTIPILLWGLAQSTPVDLGTESGLFNIESFDPKASFFIAVLSQFARPDLGMTQGLELNPVAIAGCLGLLIATINLMPVGQLNGGKIVHAMFGQRTGAIIGQVARLLVLLLAYVQRGQNEFWILAILLFFMPSVDEPALDDVSELDNKRDFWGLAALALLISIVLPAPPAITQLLF